MNIYLAGPITGIPNKNRDLFTYVAEKLRNEGHKVFNPTSLPDDMTSARALSYEVDYICNQGVEALAFLPGWENSKGSKVEHALAVALDLKRIYLDEEYTKIPDGWAASYYTEHRLSA